MCVDPDPLVGTKLADRYEILSVIGRGGMGVVYQAKHEHLGRVVAIKMLHSHLVSEPEALKRFHREAKAISRVKHPHTVTLYDFGISPQGQPYLVMDYIEGISLKRILRQQGPLSLDKAQHIFSQVIEALACAHAEGVIHRDLKPENIMLTERAGDPTWVKVVDFGISKLRGKDDQTVYNITRIGDVCGSPPYMSPEQCLASVPVDGRSDIYSLAVVIYEALCGRLPFKAKSAVEMIDCHLYSAPTPFRAAHPDLTCCDALTAFLSRALQKEPEKRQRSMEEFGQELAEAIARDLVKLKSYRHLSQAIAHEATLTESRLAPESATTPLGVSGQLGKTQQDICAYSAKTAAKGNWLTRLTAGLGSLFGRHEQASPGEGYVHLSCPYCQAEVQANIKFCLDCGHVLPSAQELTRLRAAQGVFNFPKSVKIATEQPEFSKRARRVLSRPASRFSGPFLIFNLVLLLLLCWVYFGESNGGKEVPGIKQTAQKMKDSGAKPAKQRPAVR